MDTLVGIRVFVAVAELRSFVTAAGRMGISTAMASKHVQQLEMRLGARLLNRTSRSVSLTEAGTIYLDRVRPLLDGLDDAEAALSSSRIEPTGLLRVSVPTWMANPGFARLVASFQARHPGVVLDLDLSARHVNLVEEGFDLALRVARVLDNGLVARRIAEVPFYLVASPAFLDRHGRPEKLTDLMGASLVAYTRLAPNGRVRLGRDEAAVDISFRPVLVSNNENLILLAAREGMGHAFLPALLVKEDLAGGVLEYVLPEMVSLNAPVHAVYPRREFMPAKVRSFLDHVTGPEGLSRLADA